MKVPLIKKGWLRALLFLLAFTLVILLQSLYLQPLLLSSGFTLKLPAGESEGMNLSFVFLGLTISAVLSYLMVWIFRKLVDRASVQTLGFGWAGNRPHAITGLLLGPLLIGLGTFIFILLQKLEWVDMQTDFQPLLLTLGMMIIIAFAEELVFRGYILNNLMQSMNKWIALVLSALVFSAFHANNPDVSALSLVNLFVGGLLLGINYIYTKNLWFGIFLHFTWNYYQGSILGYGVSGLPLPSLAHHQRTGSAWLTGGAFGFEGSVICTTVSLLALLFLAWTYEKKALAVEK